MALLGRLLRRDFSLHARLTDYRTYERQIQYLHTKHLFTRQLYALQENDVPLATLSMNAARVGKLIAQAIRSEQYQLRPARVRSINVEGKERVVFSYGLMDLIVRSAITDLILEAITPHLSPQLYSYRKGVSWLKPAFEFAAYLHRHRRTEADPKKRGIYVLRRDIRSYTDTMPVGRDSVLWVLLREALRQHFPGLLSSRYEWSLVEHTLRPEVCGADGGLYCLTSGIPTGQPITAVLYNFYLVEFDRELGSIPGAFYARYSDDVLFAHPDAAVTAGVRRRIEQRLARLGLRVNEAKSEDLYLTVPGRPSLEWPHCRGSSCVQFVGARISADGTVALNKRKVRQFLRDIEQRASRTARALSRCDSDYVGRTVCAVINRALTSRTDHAQQRSASLLRRAVTDRNQLAQLDYWIARAVVKAVTGGDGVRGFRRVPYRKIREEWGLRSLLHSRNKWGGRGHE